jgi:hypothetical protein
VGGNTPYGGSDFDHALSIYQTQDGGYILGGFTQSYGAGGLDMWVLRLLPDGRCPPFGQDANITEVSVTPNVQNTNISPIITSAVVTAVPLNVIDTHATVMQQAP